MEIKITTCFGIAGVLYSHIRIHSILLHVETDSLQLNSRCIDIKRVVNISPEGDIRLPVTPSSFSIWAGNLSEAGVTLLKVLVIS